MPVWCCVWPAAHLLVAKDDRAPAARPRHARQARAARRLLAGSASHMLPVAMTSALHCKHIYICPCASHGWSMQARMSKARLHGSHAARARRVSPPFDWARDD